MRFPNESTKYRNFRNRLLKEELALRSAIEKVAAARRKLPPGGEVPQDYVFEGESGKVRLSQLFERGNTLVAYSFMYGPKMAHACPMCTSFLDGLDGNTQHIAQRTNLVVIAKSPIERIVEYARGRGWRNLRLLSSAGNTYNATTAARTSAARSGPCSQRPDVAALERARRDAGGPGQRLVPEARILEGSEGRQAVVPTQGDVSSLPSRIVTLTPN